MLIRRASKDEVALLAKLGPESYRDHYAHLWGADALSRWLDDQFDPVRLAGELGSDEVSYQLLFEGERAVGFAKSVRDQQVPGHPELLGRELQKIYFLRDAAGRGLGAHLLDVVIADVRAGDEPLIWLDVIKPNEGGQRFYQRHGFERVGELPWATDRGEFGKWLMVRRF